MKKKTVWVDMDHTSVDFETSFKKDIKKQLKNIKYKIRKSYQNFENVIEGLNILIPLRDKLENYLSNGSKLTITEEELYHFTYPQSKKNFFLYLKPIDGAKENILKLQKYFDVKFLTRPSYLNPLSYTEKRLWVEYNYDLDMCQHLYFAPDKSFIKGDYLIDDNLWKDFEGIQLHFGSDGLETWDKIYKKLIEIEGI